MPHPHSTGLPPEKRPSSETLTLSAYFLQVQLRKWIRNIAALEKAAPTAKCLATCGRGDSPDQDSPSSLDANVSKASLLRHNTDHTLCSIPVFVQKPSFPQAVPTQAPLLMQSTVCMPPAMMPKVPHTIMSQTLYHLLPPSGRPTHESVGCVALHHDAAGFPATTCMIAPRAACNLWSPPQLLQPQAGAPTPAVELAAHELLHLRGIEASVPSVSLALAMMLGGPSHQIAVGTPSLPPSNLPRAYSAEV